MKKTSKAFSVILAVLMLFSVFSIGAFAQESVTVSLRIEGIDSCIYYKDVTVPASSTAYDVLVSADKADDSLTVDAISSKYGTYLQTINGIKAGNYTVLGWDGWLYMVNGEVPVDPDNEELQLGLGDYVVKNGDNIVIYYGDPYGAAGMQYPVMDTSKLGDGIVSFTSMDTVYDEYFKPTTSENVVYDYTLIWEYNGKTVELTPDENGVCKIPYKYLTIGDHNIQIERYDEKTGLPTVLRFAPDTEVNIGIFDGILAFFKMIAEFITSLFA